MVDTYIYIYIHTHTHIHAYVQRPAHYHTSGSMTGILVGVKSMPNGQDKPDRAQTGQINGKAGGRSPPSRAASAMGALQHDHERDELVSAHSKGVHL